MGQKHRWTFQEDQECCETCVQQFVVNKSNLSANELIKDLSDKLPEIPETSLRMKISNIKQLLEEHGIDNTLNIKPLAKYSKQNERAMNIALSKLSKS